MRIYLDATTVIALGTVGELSLLHSFDGRLVVLPAVRNEVTTEPAKTNLDRFLDAEDVESDVPLEDVDVERAMDVLGESAVNGDVLLIAAVLAHRDRDQPVGVVSDDRRVRTVARGFGGTVTGTIGVIVRAVEDGLDEAEAKRLVRRIDRSGLHMTAALRERAAELIEHAARD